MFGFERPTFNCDFLVKYYGIEKPMVVMVLPVQAGPARDYEGWWGITSLSTGGFPSTALIPSY